MEFRKTTDLLSTTYADALAIRKTVFVEEQNVDESLEIDDLEDQTLHLVGYVQDKPACTARLLKKDNGDIKIQRVAVLKDYRGTGLGLKLIQEIERFAVKELNGSRLILDSQDHATPFYEKAAYTVEGDGFLDAGIPHHFMQKRIDQI